MVYQTTCSTLFTLEPKSVVDTFIASKVGPNQCLRMRGGGGGYECTVQITKEASSLT